MTPNILSGKLLIASVLISVAATAGCQTVGFPNPGLSSLAFWNRDGDASKLPPPPARHFDPSRIDGESGIVSDDSLNIEMPADDRPERSLVDNDGSARPPRKRYEMGQASGEPASDGNQFDPQMQPIESDFDSGYDSGAIRLTEAQEEFQQAMQSAGTDLKDSFSNEVERTGNAIGQAVGESANRMRQQGMAEINRTTDAWDRQLNEVSDAANEQFGQFQNQTREQIQGLSSRAEEIVNRPFPDLGSPSPRSTTDADRSSALQEQRRRSATGPVIQNEFVESPASTLEGQRSGQALAAPASPGSTGGFTMLAPLQPTSPGGSSTGSGDFESSSAGQSSSSSAPPLTNDSAANGTFDPGAFAPPGSSSSDSGFRPAGTDKAINQSQSETGSAGTLESRVGALEIPDVILNSDGSFAPGSVRQVQRR